MNQLPGDTESVHWARKHSSEIGAVLIIFAFIFFGIGIWWYAQPEQKPQTTGVTLPPPAVAQPQPVVSHKPTQVRSEPTHAPAPQRIVQQPILTPVSWTSSTETVFLWSNTLFKVSVYRINTLNNFTAITFKVDGSQNHIDATIQCNPSPQNTYIVDNTGYRTNFVGPTTDTPFYLNCSDQAFFYHFAPHEIVYPTYLFYKLPANIVSFDVTFASFPLKDGQEIHVVM